MVGIVECVWIWVCVHVYIYTRGTPKKLEFFYKKLCIYSYMFKLQSPSKYSRFDAIHLLRLFFPLLKTVFKHFDFDAFLLPFFPTSPTSVKHFSLRTFFIWGNKKKSHQVWLGDLERVGHKHHTVLVKNCWTLSVMWAGALVNHPSWNERTCWKSLHKNLLKPNAASHNNTSWYTDIDRFLEHSPSQGNL